MRSRFLSELTTGEVGDYLAQGGKLALLPVGSTEMHGPHLPIGTDALVAKAFALRFAEKAGGVVLPEIGYTWAGATDGFPGTVSVEPELLQKTVEAVAGKVFRMGFRQLVLINAHSPNQFVLFATVRRLFEDRRPVFLFDVYRPISNDNCLPQEASLLLAALRILGKPELYPERELQYEDPAPPLDGSLRRLSRAGTVGYFFQDARQHVAPNLQTSLREGLDYIEAQAESLLPLMGDMEAYIGASARQGNQGWWKKGDEA